MKRRTILMALISLAALTGSWALDGSTKTYQSQTYGFEFKYPVNDSNGTPNQLHEMVPDSQLGYLIIVRPEYGADVVSTVFSVRVLATTIDREIEKAKASYKDSPSIDIDVKVSDAGIPGVSAKKLESEVFTRGNRASVSMRFKDYYLDYPNHPGQVLILSGDQKIAETFRFTNP